MHPSGGVLASMLLGAPSLHFLALPATRQALALAKTFVSAPADGPQRASRLAPLASMVIVPVFLLTFALHPSSAWAAGAAARTRTIEERRTVSVKALIDTMGSPPSGVSIRQLVLTPQPKPETQLMLVTLP